MLPLVLLVIGVPCALWSVFALLTTGGSEAVEFSVTAGTFVLLAVGYLNVHGLKRMAWITVPVLLTIQSVLTFVVIPVWQFSSGADRLDSVYVHSMVLVLIGFTAFWIGGLAVRRDVELQFVPSNRDTPERLEFISAAMLVLGLGANVFLWRTGLYSYAADPLLRAANQGIMLWVETIANLTTSALVVSAIELFGKQSGKLFIRVVFWLSLASLMLLGAITGMKSATLIPMLYVVIVYGITRGRVPRAAVLVPVFLVVVIYPFVGAYRDNLNSGYRAQMNTVGGLEAVVVKSFDDAFLTFGSRNAGAENGNLNQAKARLNYLSDVRDVIGLPDPSLLKGDETIWMAPIYPLVPRLLWKNKPVMDKGVRLAHALGSSSGTSDALTPIGDLYSMYGTFGVVMGMLVYGLGFQLFTNWAGGRLSEMGLFIYASMLLSLLDFEGDFVVTIAGFIHTVIVVALTAVLIYGQFTHRTPARKARVGS